jgi:hypothetical protein
MSHIKSVLAGIAGAMMAIAMLSAVLLSIAVLGR